MNPESLETLQAELARQNESLAAFEQTLRSLGDVELAVPQAFLDELEELTSARVFNNPNTTMPFLGIRG